ncbi:hypothetical protein DITRI_Ditri07aG0098100 [Diplodiscus trichospermus]
MAGKAAQSVAKAMGGYQCPWREKLSKYKVIKGECGVIGNLEPGSLWASVLGVEPRLRKEVPLAGQDWPYDPERKEVRTRMKGLKCDRIAADEKRGNTANLMRKNAEMLLAYKKHRWEKKMKM